MNAQVELAGRSRKGQLKHADRLGARYVALVGDETTVLKDMHAGEQRDVPTDGLVARILRERSMP
jgi:histidyl-tRNA synthetase